MTDARPPGAAPRTPDFPGRWLYLIAVGLVFAAFLAACLHGVANYWQWGHDGFNGAAFSQAARNSLRFGTLAQAQYWFELTPPDPEQFYTHHPMLLHFHLMGAYAALGHHEWVGRLIPAFYSFGALVLLFLVTRRTLGRAVALVAITLYALTPLNLIFANMVNHEQGSIFWCLAFLYAYLRWLDARGGRWFVACVLATTMAVQFDWPGYYIAFFVASHTFLTGLRRTGRLRWCPEFTFVAGYSVFVLANFLGFFGWIASVRGGLGEMGQAFLGRAAEHPDYLNLLWERSLDLHGPLLVGLLAAWVVSYAWRAARGRAGRGELVPLFFLLAQVIHSSVFRSAGGIHSYWVFHASPAIAVGGAVVLVGAGRWLLAHTPRLGPAVLALAAALVLTQQAAFAYEQLRWGFRTGKAAYVDTYDDQHTLVAWGRDLARRYDREEVRYLVHPSLRARVEFAWYLDAPLRTDAPLDFRDDDLAEARPVLLLDLERLQARDALSTLVEAHGATIWDRRFVAIDPHGPDPHRSDSHGPGAPSADGPGARPSITAYVSAPRPAGLLRRWLVNPDRPALRWLPDPDPEEARALLRPPSATPWPTLAGGDSGRRATFRCDEDEAVAGLTVRTGALGRLGVVAAVRPECRADPPPPTQPRRLLSGVLDSLDAPAGLDPNWRGGPWLGGEGREAGAVTCADADVPVGLHGRSGTLVDAVGLLCTPRASVGDGTERKHRASRLLGGRSGQPFELRCPRGEILIGLRVRAGALLDAAGIECRPLADATASGADPGSKP